VPRKMIGTLTLSNSKSAYISTTLIILYKLYSVATIKHSKPFSLANYIRVVTAAPDLRVVSIYSTVEFFLYNSTMELISLLINYKGVVSKL
jgi:hypothetical protein